MTRSSLPALLGAALGLAAYFLLSAGLAHLLGPTAFFGRVLHHWVNALTLTVFGAAVGSLTARWRDVSTESQFFTMALLPPLSSQRVFRSWIDVQPYADRLFDLSDNVRRSRPLQLLDTCFRQARMTWSTDLVGTALDRQAELLQVIDDRKHTLGRFAVWAIPTLGFIGTVMGIGEALRSMHAAGLAGAIEHLHTVFDTTFVALLLSLPANWLHSRVQAEDDASLASAVDWCQQHFVLAIRDNESTPIVGSNSVGGLVKVIQSPRR